MKIELSTNKSPEQNIPSEPFFDNTEAVIDPEEYSKITNQIQIILMKKSGIDLLEWVNKYSEKFREIIERFPEKINVYKKDPEAVIDFLQDELYKDEQNYPEQSSN